MTVKQMIDYVGGGFRYYPLNTLAAIRKAYAPFYPTWNQGKYEKFLANLDFLKGKRFLFGLFRKSPRPFFRRIDTGSR